MLTKNPTLKNCVRAFPGARFHFRTTSAETGGSLAIIDITMSPGSEPIRHIHANEDETIIVHSGAIHYFAGEEKIIAQKGDVVFLPRGVPHHFKVISPIANVTLVLTPGGFEHFFEGITFPFEGDDLPPVTSDAFSEEKRARVKRLSEKFHVQLLP
jgi:quercetin dioxygenase-like cupin family protein